MVMWRVGGAGGLVDGGSFTCMYGGWYRARPVRGGMVIYVVCGGIGGIYVRAW